MAEKNFWRGWSTEGLPESRIKDLEETIKRTPNYALKALGVTFELIARNPKQDSRPYQVYFVSPDDAAKDTGYLAEQSGVKEFLEKGHTVALQFPSGNISTLRRMPNKLLTSKSPLLCDGVSLEGGLLRGIIPLNDALLGIIEGRNAQDRSFCTLQVLHPFPYSLDSKIPKDVTYRANSAETSESPLRDR